VALRALRRPGRARRRRPGTFPPEPSRSGVLSDPRGPRVPPAPGVRARDGACDHDWTDRRHRGCCPRFRRVTSHAGGRSPHRRAGPGLRVRRPRARSRRSLDHDRGPPSHRLPGLAGDALAHRPATGGLRRWAGFDCRHSLGEGRSAAERRRRRQPRTRAGQGAHLRPGRHGAVGNGCGRDGTRRDRRVRRQLVQPRFDPGPCTA